MLVGSSCTAELIQDDPGGLAKALALPIPVVALELPSYQKKENWGAAETFYQLVRTLAGPSVPPPGTGPAAGPVTGAVVLVEDVTVAHQVERLRKDFVANVSHELKTPLALVRMFAEMLQSGRVGSDEKRKEYLDIIVKESERLSALIENVLDFARLERGRGNFELEASIADVLKNNGLIADEARRAGIASPLLDHCHALFAQAQAQGRGAQDMVAVLHPIGCSKFLADPS